MRLPRDIGPIHFVGIGGIGMSGIAEVLANLGYTVRGSDVADSANVKRLRDKGIAVDVGHKAENVVGSDVVVDMAGMDGAGVDVAGAHAVSTISNSEIRMPHDARSTVGPRGMATAASAIFPSTN